MCIYVPFPFIGIIERPEIINFHLFVSISYRQWKLPPPLRTSPDRLGLLAQLDRFSRVCDHIKDESVNDTPILVSGDLIIDQWADNDPLSRYDIKKLNEILVETKQDSLC